LYIDYCLDQSRPLLYDVTGGKREALRVLPQAEAALYAAEERLHYATGSVRAQTALVAALILAEEFDMNILR
jgi:hypothetical protein